jgi:hypothetical protein
MLDRSGVEDQIGNIPVESSVRFISFFVVFGPGQNPGLAQIIDRDQRAVANASKKVGLPAVQRNHAAQYVEKVEQVILCPASGIVLSRA